MQLAIGQARMGNNDDLSLIVRVRLDDLNSNAESVAFRASLVARAGDEHVVVMDDRGWTWSRSISTFGSAAVFDEICDLARVVTGPDEPAAGNTLDSAEFEYWSYVMGELAAAGVETERESLSSMRPTVALEEDVERYLSGLTD